MGRNKDKIRVEKQKQTNIEDRAEICYKQTNSHTHTQYSSRLIITKIDQMEKKKRGGGKTKPPKQSMGLRFSDHADTYMSLP